MNKLKMSINPGIGDNIIVRVFFDTIKHNYDQIIISHNRDIINTFKYGDQPYSNFLDQLGKMLFATPPYIFDHTQYTPLHIYTAATKLNIIPQKPNLDDILCKGVPLNIGEYIVITTKIRGIDKALFDSIAPQLWNTLNQLSSKYKIVVLGERKVEENNEYKLINNQVYGIYDHIISNIPNENIVDLTVPALGITIPNLEKIKQDCLIMKGAKFVLVLAVGGNLWLAISVANVICFRSDNGLMNNYINDKVSCLTNPKFANSFITPNWNQFLNKIIEYK